MKKGNCFLRVLLVLQLGLIQLTISAQITSAGSGNWTSPATWVGGVVPTLTDNVVIAAGHVIIVNALAECNSISFGAATAKLNMSAANSQLSIYGNFTAFDATHAVFSAWVTGAKVRFAGNAAVQTISGPPINAAPAFSFMEMIVDKTSGKVTTGGGGMRLGLGTSLDITGGTFELATNDDIEGRNLSGTGATTPAITVGANDSLVMLGVNSHIRSGNQTGDNTSKIGKLTVYGFASLIPNQTNRLNFGDIDIENGGVIEIAGGGSNTQTFNPGTITVKPGATLISTKDINYWYANTTTPTQVIIQNAGIFDFNGLTNQNFLPQTFTTDPGSYVRYSKPAQMLSIDSRLSSYYNLILVGSSKSLSQSIAVSDSLFMRTSVAPTQAPSLNLAGFTLSYSSTATLVYRGIGATPAAQTTASAEWPASGNRPFNVQIYNKADVTLNETKSIDGTLNLRGNTGESSKLIIGAFDISVATVSGYNADKYVKTNGTGKLIISSIGAVAKVLPIGNSTYNPVVISNGSNLGWGGNVEDNLVVTEAPFLLNVPYAVQRTWSVAPLINPPPSGAEVIFQYNDVTDVIPANFNTTEPVQVWYNPNTFWHPAGTTQPPVNVGGNSRTATISNWTDFSKFAISTMTRPLPVRMLSFTGKKVNGENLLQWVTTTEINSSHFEIQRSINGTDFISIGSVASKALQGNSSSRLEYSFVDKQASNSGFYYRIAHKDKINQISYSTICYIEADRGNKIFIREVYPNPVQNNANFKVIADNRKAAVIVITDMTGRVLLSQDSQFEKGQNDLTLNLAALASGKYVVRIFTADEQCAATFIKVD